MPLTTPVALFTLAIVALLLLHTPPVVASASVVVLPVQRVVVPVMAATVGAMLMVMTLVTMAVPQLPVTV